MIKVNVIETPEGRYAIKDDGDDEYFYNHNNKIRTYTQPGGATAFLRNTGYDWAAKMPSGRTVYINCENPETAVEYGPHEHWRKENAVTIIDNTGNYDIWRCDACGEETKRYGLSGRPGSHGSCKKNPVDKEE